MLATWTDACLPRGQMHACHRRRCMLVTRACTYANGRVRSLACTHGCMRMSTHGPMHVCTHTCMQANASAIRADAFELPVCLFVRAGSRRGVLSARVCRDRGRDDADRAHEERRRSERAWRSPSGSLALYAELVLWVWKEHWCCSNFTCMESSLAEVRSLCLLLSSECGGGDW
eukprot:3633391-Pleurochrysis_carterae.AAC.1